MRDKEFDNPHHGHVDEPQVRVVTDTKRLDWMVRNRVRVNFNGRYYVVVNGQYQQENYATARDAIDAAMKDNL